MKKQRSTFDPSKPVTDFGAAHIDPFYYDQPPLEFIEELKKPIYTKKPSGYNTRRIRDGEALASGIYLDTLDYKDEPLLDSAYQSFAHFAKTHEIDGKRYPVALKKCDTGIHESYKITISENGATVESGDTEGVRRAIVFLENELSRREGAFLPLCEISKRPYIKSRITRGFFSPTNRPPKLGDELSDDIDYYPEEYLNRLMHDGTNGIWIYTSFKQLMYSSVFEHHGEGSEKRIEKLRGVVEKCARYGVKVYIFAIEPAFIMEDVAEKYPSIIGGHNEFGQHSICLETEAGKKFLLEATEKLFRLVPGLGGYIDITAGERVTSCPSFPIPYKTCPRCSKIPRGEALARAANLIREGIRRAGTDAEFISWTYGHKNWEEPDIADYVLHCENDVMLMQNFEENSYAEQLGRLRIGKDYWLSHVGPGELFKFTANEAKKHGKPIYAKMQICCSHELATVPYVPTPGIIFDKYKAAREYGTEGVMQCWYFGNYPSVMSKAAGELSFVDDFSDKDSFLKNLAAAYYGESLADNVSEVWKLFEEAYKNYPLNIMFSYYGPMHDGVVWELQLKPKDNCLSRSWLLLDAPDGDRIHEALWEGHTLDEALTLAERIRDKWNTGLSMLNLPEDDEMCTLSRALGLLFSSGRNILRFYKMRAMLGRCEGNPSEILSELEEIVRAEIENSEKMIPLCQMDKRLGYHSEAEGFKFFPKKLESRIEKLKELLKTEFIEIKERIDKNLPPLEFYLGEENGRPMPDAYLMKKGVPEYRKIPDSPHSFAMSYTNDTLTLVIDTRAGADMTVGFEFEPLMPSPTLMINKSGEIDFVSQAYTHQSLFGDKIEKEKKKYSVTVEEYAGGVKYTVTMKRREVGWVEDRALRLRLKVCSSPLKASKIPLRYLAKWNEYPDTHVFIIPE